jgi:probable rRNA maturation factor
MNAMHDKSMNEDTLYDIDISVEDDRWDAVISPENFSNALEQLWAELPADEPFRALEHNFELSLTLCDDAFIQKINAQWREQDKATNVLSFPQIENVERDLALYPAGAEVPIGDIFIAYDTVHREASEQNKALPDHITHMFIHGFLHLIGYDHIEDDEAEEMEALETRILKRLNIANPYETLYTQI